MSINRAALFAVLSLILLALPTWLGANAGGNSAAEATTPRSAASVPKYQIQVGVAQQGDQFVIAVVDSETGQVRSCWIGGRDDKPDCSAWSD